MSAETSPGAGKQADLLERARSQGFLSLLDQQFADRLAKLYGESGDDLRWALAIASRQLAAGHVCADLARLSEAGLVSEVAGEVRSLPLLATRDTLVEWLDSLGTSALIAREADAVADATGPRPLVLDPEGRLYLLRAFRDQEGLARAIAARSLAASYPVDWPTLTEAIERLSPGEAPDDPSRQALRVGLARPLSIVTGGPGTGKTTMVARLISILIEEAIANGRAVPRVRLLAPTGKAAAAMAGAFARGRDRLAISDAIRAALPTSAETIHRALHPQTRRDAFGRPHDHQLEAEVVVVDEASMVDLAMMHRLFLACERVPRVILLGDADQLASVDAGAVLAELCAEPPGIAASQRGGGFDPMSTERPASVASGLSGGVVRLTKSHRFADGGGIGRLAHAIRAGDADEALALLADPTIPEIERFEVGKVDQLFVRLAAASRGMREAISLEQDPAGKLEKMLQYRVLCAHRQGPLGVESLCARLDQASVDGGRVRTGSGWWKGRMLLVTRNAPDQDLWNGDVGLIDEGEDGLRALFSDGAGGVRSLSAGRMPTHESAIAMSVHKSQGSEFAVVDLVLGDRASPLLSRELFYTGVTRARETLRVHASEATLREMIARQVERDSALALKLWSN